MTINLDIVTIIVIVALTPIWVFILLTLGGLWIGLFETIEEWFK